MRPVRCDDCGAAAPLIETIDGWLCSPCAEYDDDIEEGCSNCGRSITGTGTTCSPECERALRLPLDPYR